MAWLTRFTWMLIVVAVVATGCTNHQLFPEQALQFPKKAETQSQSVPQETNKPLPAEPLKISKAEGIGSRVTRMQNNDPLPPPRSDILQTSNTTSNSLAPPTASPQLQSVRVAAWVNSRPIFQSDLETAAASTLASIRSLPEPERSQQREKILKEFLQKLIDDEVVIQDAFEKLKGNEKFLTKLKEAASEQYSNWLRDIQEKSKLTEAQLAQQMRSVGISLLSRKREIERRFIVMEYMRSRIGPYMDQVNRQDIRDYYDSHPEEFQQEDRLVWEDIFIAVGPKHPTLADARSTAQKLLTQIQQGASFASLIEYDDGVSRFQKGKGSGERRGEIKPAELESILFQLRPGQVGPVFELSTGVHIFRVVERDYAGKIPFNMEVQDKIRKKLRSQIGNAELERIVRHLASTAVIEVDPTALR